MHCLAHSWRHSIRCVRVASVCVYMCVLLLFVCACVCMCVYVCAYAYACGCMDARECIV